MASKSLCSIPDCGKPTKGRGWCATHYHRWTRHGDPLGGGTFYGEALRFLDEVVTPAGGHKCVPWPFARSSAGYAEIRLGGTTRLVHRLVCERRHGKPPTPKHEAAHSCGNGHLGCVNPDHLSWKTRSGNKADELAHGTRNRGNRNGSSRLTEGQVRAIRSLQGRNTAKAIAKDFGVSDATVRDIFHGRCWGWLL